MNGNALFATFRSMEILLYIASAYLTFTTMVLIRNWFEFRGLSEQNPYSPEQPPLVSICIPARNEEEVIDRCVTFALKQNYPNFEVLVLDDNSTDKTTEILAELSEIITNLYHLKGKPKPDDWLGKPWACHQLSEQAKGEYLIFIDADVWLEETAISKAVSALQKSDVITVWPKQYVETFWEKLIIPIVYYGLFTLLPSRYVERAPRWLPKNLRSKLNSKFTAACGQFIAFNKNIYSEINGHQSVKQEVVEDLELSKIIKKNGFKLAMYHGVSTVNCRMYRSHREIFEGFCKNFFTGFGKSTPLFLLMAALQFLVFILPAILLVTGDEYIQTFAAGLIGVVILQRWALDYWFGWNPLISILHPLSILWFEILGIRSLWDHYAGKKAKWKDREIP